MATMLISFQPKLKHVLFVDSCRNCGRYIKTDRVKMHETSCRIGSQKGIFDGALKQKTKSNLKQSAVNERRMEFQKLMESIRNRGYIIDVSLPPPLIHQDYVQCLSCLRLFHSDAAYRHIPKCPYYEFNKVKQSSLVAKSNRSKSRK